MFAGSLMAGEACEPCGAQGYPGGARGAGGKEPRKIREGASPRRVTGGALRPGRMRDAGKETAPDRGRILDQGLPVPCDLRVIERGEWNLTLDTVGSIADKLGLHPLDLLTGHAPPPGEGEAYEALPGVDLGR